MKRFYWIVRNSQRVGPFGLEALQEKVNSGEFGPQDFVFYPGCKGLERLSGIEGIYFGGPPAMDEPEPVTAGFSQPHAGTMTQPDLNQYGALPPIRQTISLANPVSGFQAQAPVAPERPQQAAPPRARMPDPGTVTERTPHPAVRPEPRTVAPRVTAKVMPLDVIEDDPTEGPASRAYVSRPMPGRIQPQPAPVAMPAPAPEPMPQPEPLPRKPTKVVSKRDLPREKDRTERLDPLVALAASPHAPTSADPGINIDFSSIEAALNKPAPTGASVKIPAPIAGARPLSTLSSVAAEAPAAPEVEPMQPRIVTKRITSTATPPHLRGGTGGNREGRQPLQPAMAFSDEMFSKQTMVIGAPPRSTRSRRAADDAYPQVISKPEPHEPMNEIAKEPPREVLDSVRYSELARPAESTPVVEPEFTNSLGMGFVQVANLPLGFGLWQVRVRDFRAFCDATAYDAGPKWRSPDFLQLEDNPVIFVSWDDAQEFCKWLTLAEQEAGWIDADQFYRLPSDTEWSAAVGLRNEIGATPAERHGKFPGVYPWGKEWPPPDRAGNYADESAARRLGWEPIAPGYDDGQVFTARVGSYHVSPSGIYDLSGNVWEWVEDWFDEEETRRALRGGSWTSSRQEELLSTARDSDLSNARRGKNGFRVVLATI